MHRVRITLTSRTILQQKCIYRTVSTLNFLLQKKSQVFFAHFNQSASLVVCLTLKSEKNHEVVINNNSLQHCRKVGRVGNSLSQNRLWQGPSKPENRN